MPTRPGPSTPARGRMSEEKTPPVSSRRGKSEDEEETPKGGWGEVAKRQKAAAARKKEVEDGKGAIRDFWLKGGESAVVQILNDEPFIVDGHNVKVAGNFTFEPCQLAKQKWCLMCREKVKVSWKAGFKVLDYRGKWDKEAKEFSYDEPIEKLWLVNQTILGQLQTIKTKRGKELTELVLEVSRTGTTKDNTSYNFETAYDEKENKMQAIDWEEEFPSVKELTKPKKDEELIELGFEAISDK